ncbi:MAG: HEAT repeat domain-containing protein [Ignavibacteriales bacterium]|nr:HEAT repeat domain-containing protein [Ignavibacteriales bacterium]MBK7980604.1 HEAT repeat domain-containing protein [Ignavibacteriota bacterium]
MGNNYEVIKKILDTDDSEKIRTTAENFQLVEMPDKVVEYLTQKLTSDDNGVKDTLTRILSNNKNSNIPKYLVPYVSSENISARNLAGEILLKRKNESIKAMIEYLPNANDDDKKFIIDLLGLIGNPAPAYEIISILKYSRDENVILACIEALGNIKSEEAIDEIIVAYDRSELFRPTIIEALGKIGTDECIDFINDNYYGVDELTKYSLIESLGRIGNEKSFNMLINDIKYLEGPFKWVAIETIGKLEEKKNLLLPNDIALKNSLLETLQSADLQYKKSAVRLISLFEGENIVEHLFSIFGNDEEIDNKLREYFSNNLKTFFKKAIPYLKENPRNLKSFIGLIKEMIQYDGGLSMQALNDLEMRNYVEIFSNLLTHPDEEIRASSMELLFFLDSETAFVFSDTMLEDTVSWNRIRLLEIIQYGDDTRIIEIIKKLSEDNDEMVRENAQNILSERGISNFQLKD